MIEYGQNQYCINDLIGGKIDLQRKRFILAIFLLEELSLRIEENSNPIFKRLEFGFIDFINELPEALGVIK